MCTADDRTSEREEECSAERETVMHYVVSLKRPVQTSKYDYFMVTDRE